MSSSPLNTFSFTPTEEADETDFQILIASCGYESRSTHVAKSMAGHFGQILAFGYPEQRTLSLPKNEAYFSSVGSVELPATLAEYETRLGEVLRGVAQSEGASIAFDVSSLNRERLAAVIRVLRSIPLTFGVDVTFFYSIGSFDSHSEGSESRILVNGPLRGFEGWSDDPSKPVASVIGLGFENLMALAALETLEPARTVAFVAESEDARFQTRVLDDNESLIRSSEVSQVTYRVEDAFSSLHQLEGVVFALRRHYRVAIVPLGPKLFALLALLVATQYPDDVAVWRVSADAGAEPQDRQALGPISPLKIRVIPGDAQLATTNSAV